MSLKLLDYGRPNPFGEIIGKTRYLPWPVNAYRVTLPKASQDDDGLNAFERVILKIIDASGEVGADALAVETCIPLDLVKGILLRLQDKSLIDKYGNIIKKMPDTSEREAEKDPVFVTALLFRELATGKILPSLHWLDDANPIKKMEGQGGSFRLIPLAAAHEKNRPAPRDVISAFRAMKKRSAAFGRGDKMPAVQQITIAPSPELYLLECPIAIQKCDDEFRIADPFGNGFSVILERAFEQLLEQKENEKLVEWLHKWKESLHNPHPSNPSYSDQRSKEPFENEVNWQRYPKLVANLRPSRNEQFRSISKIHASLEWAMFYACIRRPFEDAIAKLKFTGQHEHPALLENAAKSIGLELFNHTFWPIREGKLLDFQNGQAEFDTVLAINILQAQKYEPHPLNRIASAHPSIIGRLLGIKQKRNDDAHGKGRVGTREIELSDDSIMRDVVHSLLPDIIFGDTPTVTGTDKDDRADARLEARTSIQNEFSFKVFNHLGKNLQSRLIHSERFWFFCKDGYKDAYDARSFADDLYASVQSAFEKRLAGKLPPDVSDLEFVSAAERRAYDAGLGAALPKELSTVKTLAIRQALQGGGSTLGAYAVAFLLVSDDDTLRSIADSQPFFINEIATIIKRRGHCNEPLPLPLEDIKKLRKGSYKTIKTLIEA